MGVFLTIYRQLSGVITIVLYSSILISDSSVTLGPYSDLIMSLILLCSTLVGILIADKLPRRISLVASSIAFSLCNFMVMTGLLIKSSTFSLIWMGLLVLFYGVLFSPIYERYLEEILMRDQMAMIAWTGWPSLIFVTLIPPIVAEVMPDYLPWPIFLFFGVVSFFAIFYLWFYLKETRNRQYL